jgi:hypothetical protein
MHAVVVKVKILDKDTAEERLKDQVVPQVSGAPGFVAGQWVNLGQDQGVGIMSFESEEQANAAAGQIRGSENQGAVTFDSVEVGQVAARA